MSRKRSHTRHTVRSNPRGRLDVRQGGYGFVQTAEGEYFVPAKKMKGAFPGDVVEVVPVKDVERRRGRTAGSGNRKRVARVVSVVERAHDEFVGYFHRAEPFGVVEPADPLIRHDIFTLLSEHPEIPDGAVVRVAITTWPDRNTAATGTVVEVIGDEDDERMAIDLIVARHKLETSFSETCLEQAQAASVDGEGALQEGYRDLRDRFVFTIDPADAKDFDDAVSIEPVVLTNDGFADAAVDSDGTSGPSFELCTGQSPLGPKAGQLYSPESTSLPLLDQKENHCCYWRVGVHIADVSHYVSWGSAVDLDARKRATSVYLADRVIPMLPEKLSNDVCSLKPGQVRRTMTVDMVVDAQGRVVDVEAYPALICSNARLTYDEVQSCIDCDEPLGPELETRIGQLSRIAKQRAALRKEAGGLDFDTVEAKVRLDEAGHPVDVDLREKTDATQLIEEAMIMANEAVARMLCDAGFPCLYRVHEKPAIDSLEGLVPVLQEFDWFKDVNANLFIVGNPHAIASVLDACAGRPEDALVTTLVLRSMKRAVYSPALSIHYGLASAAYAHFTSPIRRYPDLVVHRMLRALLTGRPAKFDQEVSNLSWIAEHSSEMERVAEQAARESQECKLVELMEEHVGETFSALVSGVATFGLFVRLDNTAEGVVEMGDLGHEYFILDPVRHTLTGSDSGRQFRLGRRLAVRLIEADRRTRQLRFRLLK